MTTAPQPQGVRSVGPTPVPIHPVADESIAEDLLEPTAGMVLHRVLALAARTFLLNDTGDAPVVAPAPCEVVSPDSLRLPDESLWAQATADALNSAQRRTTEVERVHQSRVALRRIRSNLRTFRLALDPGWGTSLRAELGWYGGRLGQVRDLHILQDVVTITGPKVVDPEYIDRLNFILGNRMTAALAEVADERHGERRSQLNSQMMVLWNGPEFKTKAQRPANEVLPPCCTEPGAICGARPGQPARTRVMPTSTAYGSDSRTSATAARRWRSSRGDRPAGQPRPPSGYRASSETSTTPGRPSPGSRIWPSAIPT